MIDDDNLPRRQSLSDTALAAAEHLHDADSAIAGRGLFTARAFPAREIITFIAGEVIDAAECARREAAGNVYIYWLDDDAFIDGANSRTLRYLNHACAFNAVVEGRDRESMFLVAARDIAAGEEITIDYDFPEIYALCQRLNPACRAPSCRPAPG